MNRASGNLVFLPQTPSSSAYNFFFFLVLYYFSVKDSFFGESKMEEILDEKEEDSAVPGKKY
jgi:hypothetical protein